MLLGDKKKVMCAHFKSGFSCSLPSLTLPFVVFMHSGDDFWHTTLNTPGIVVYPNVIKQVQVRSYDDTFCFSQKQEEEANTFSFSSRKLKSNFVFQFRFSSFAYNNCLLLQGPLFSYE